MSRRSMPSFRRSSPTPTTGEARRVLFRGADLGEELAELAAAVHLERDVAAADQLALDVQLRISRPVGVALERLADLGLFENVDVLEFGTDGAQRGDRLRRESTLWKIRRPLHEQHHGTSGQLRLDSLDHIHLDYLVTHLDYLVSLRRSASTASSCHCSTALIDIHLPISSPVRRQPTQKPCASREQMLMHGDGGRSAGPVGVGVSTR